MERYSFRIVSSESPETMRKLCLSAKFPHQEIRWNYLIFRRLKLITFSEKTRAWIPALHKDILFYDLVFINMSSLFEPSLSPAECDDIAYLTAASLIEN